MDNLIEIDGKFKVFRNFNNQEIVYGFYDSEEEAIMVINDLKRNGWPAPLFNFSSSSSTSSSSKGEREDSYIYELGSDFIIIKPVDGVFKSFGVFSKLGDAIRYKNNLVDSDWSLPDVCDENVDKRYISFYSNYFVIERVINGTYRSFGYFDTFEEALSKRNEVIVNNWDLSFCSSGPVGSRKMRYIFFNYGKYNVRKFLDGGYKGFGAYDTVEEAIAARDDFEAAGWVITPELSSRYLSKNSHISKSSRGFDIYNRVGGELKYFGSFDSLDEAILVRNDLADKGWGVSKVSSDVSSFEEDFISFDGEYYLIERYVLGRTLVYGVFRNKNLAIIERDNILANGWGGVPYGVKSEEFPYGEYIIPFDYLFNVKKDFNGVLVDFGTFHTYGEAVLQFYALRFNDWSLKSISSFSNSFFKEVVNVYDTVKLNPEVSVPFPTFTNFNKVLEFLKFLSNGKFTKNNIVSELDIDGGDFDSLVSAGKYLGLVNIVGGEFYTLYDEYRDIFILNEWDLNLELVKLILSHKPFFHSFKYYLDSGEVPSEEVISNILDSEGIYEFNDSKFKDEHVLVVYNWISWIVSSFTTDVNIAPPSLKDYSLDDISSFISAYCDIFSENLNTLVDSILNNITKKEELKNKTINDEVLDELNSLNIRDLKIMDSYSNTIFDQSIRVLDLCVDYLNLGGKISDKGFKTNLENIDSLMSCYFSFVEDLKEFISSFSNFDMVDEDFISNLALLLEVFEEFSFAYKQVNFQYSYLK